MRPPRTGAPTIPTREMARSRHGATPCGSGVDQSSSMSSSDDIKITSVMAQSNHASFVRERSVITLLAAGRHEPEGDMFWLHRLPDDRHEVRFQLLHVGLVAQLRGEGFERLGGIVLPAVEAAVNRALNAAT